MIKETGKPCRWWKCALGAALATGSIVASGCEGDGPLFVMSLQPVYTRLDLETDSRLIGQWRDEEGEVTFTFEPGTEKGKENEYKLVVKEKSGEQEVSGEFEAHIVRLGRTCFLDIYPQSSEGGSEFYRMHFARAHTMARIEVDEDSIQLEFLNAGSLKAKIEEKSVDTPCVEVDGALLLTGNTEEVQEFLFSEENDDKGFAEPLRLEKVKVGEVAR
jgi:hypothetical protein